MTSPHASPPPRPRPAQGFAVAALLLAVVPTLAACGGDEPAAAPHSSGSASASSSGSASGSAFDPCDDLRVAPVAAALGQGLRVERGTEQTPVCRLLPRTEGGPAYELNYSWFPGGLDAAFESLEIPAGRVTSPRVPGADATRLVVQRTDEAFTVTGFVQSGDLVQVVNGVAPAPYDAAKVRAATTALLAEMSGNAP